MGQAQAGTELEHLAQMIVDERGILAADESMPTIKKRFESIGVASTPDNRRAYREMLFRTKGLSKYCRGVILFDETIKQTAVDGTPLRRIIEEEGIIPGIKVDKGAKPLAGSPGEKVTEGLDGLRDCLIEYGELGARFAKWRAVIAIGDGLPTDYCLDVNSHALARYTALCVEQGILPIVEPEVLMDGAHTIDVCSEATSRLLKKVFTALEAQRVSCREILLKPNMVLSGKDCPEQATTREVAEKTVACFREAVPEDVPGIVFLSGGQSAETATAHLNEMNKLFRDDVPWKLSFSFGRALQETALRTWNGTPEDARAQKALLHQARCSGAALSGSYTPAVEAELG